ncbi:hypothetical protein PE074_04950 [Wohlfahrtiimonas chitiniclastica]|uniref:Uncharacterized protein n=1 Tax=Wohlfahrtiimonas chitiniclastica SH04 TaxID=1261130 RepID=L8XX58_9GAMM|nr:hypothetical protein [Wohlfahrtiimonas chitiniclastica]ELV07350.1 Hypothetical protein F387_01904 [Wohlfahrtiimonas chitiniclastica SH04]KZS23935.1 hypothetical protein BMY_1805 [Wohlfahrtiimonas chitiniclastica]MBS7816601.1 hypothetical protein [Wohlfahrtiimonas chitiniclastica]MBS7822482.1 hypothetical protein [Wohlfahrtiimonas chitiniclastica]MBS7830045.1 hypothetical protein [Wohlfahrtiimonas chitiniclastica]
MNKKNSTHYTILSIIVFVFGIYLVDELLSPKSKELNISQVLKWEPPKLEFADDSMIRKKNVFIKIDSTEYKTQEEIDASKEREKENWLKDYIPKSRGNICVSKIDLPNIQLVKYIEEWCDVDTRYAPKIINIKYISFKTDLSLGGNGRNYTFSCRGTDNLCYAGGVDYLNGITVAYDFWSNLNDLDDELEIEKELENIFQSQKEIEASIKKYYQ